MCCNKRLYTPPTSVRLQNLAPKIFPLNNAIPCHLLYVNISIPCHLLSSIVFKYLCQKIKLQIGTITKYYYMTMT